MDFKYSFVLALVASCAALPALDNKKNDWSIFFDYPAPEPGSRIVGGAEVAPGSIPYMVGLSNGLLVRSFLCGGSLITVRHVMTAAHCIDAVYSWGSLSSSLRGVVGTNRWNLGGISYSFSGNITHPHYLSGPIKNDIGFLITSSNVALSNLIQTVPLGLSHVDAGIPAKVSGWGRIREGGSLSAVLLELVVNTVDSQTCFEEVAIAGAAFSNSPYHDPEIEICTYHSPNFGTCRGDSGSPLVRTDTGEQIGVVSWGFPCALGIPDMFARVSAYRDWILTSLA